jgi:hypothetical protein
MYTCPENDVHLLYCDNELPAKERAKYETHLQTCGLCAKKLHSLQVIRHAFNQDAAHIGMKDADLAISYQRLQSRLRYHAIVKNTESRVPVAGLRRAIPALAAIFILAFFTPLLWRQTRAASQNPNAQTVIVPIDLRRQPSKLLQDIMITGNINQNTLPILTADAREDSAKKIYAGEPQLFTMPEIDVFKPDFIDTEIPVLNADGLFVPELIDGIRPQSMPSDFQFPADTRSGQ